MSPNVTPCHTCEAASTTSPPPNSNANRDTDAPQDPHAVRDEDETLSVQQLKAVALLLRGMKDGQVADAVGVSRRTIVRWRMEDPDFIAELRCRRRQLCEGSADRLRELLDPSIDVLTQFLRDRYDMHRFRAATAILRLASLKSVIHEKEPAAGRDCPGE